MIVVMAIVHHPPHHYYLSACWMDSLALTAWRLLKGYCQAHKYLFENHLFDELIALLQVGHRNVVLVDHVRPQLN